MELYTLIVRGIFFVILSKQDIEKYPFFLLFVILSLSKDKQFICRTSTGSV